MKNLNTSVRFVLWISLLWFISAPTAGADDSDRDAVTLDAVVVTSKRTDENFQTGDVDMEQSPAFYALIEREAFEGRMEDLSEVIEKEAGVQVRQSGGLGSFSTVSLRGSSSDQVMVFVDGILLNDASGGGVDLSNIALSDVDSIEIYRGVTAVNFGKASIGGVINIKTRRVEKELNMSASAGVGSFDTRKYAAFINHKPGRWDYLVSADYLEAENDFEILNDNGTVWNPDDDQYENRNNARVTQENLLAKAGFDITDDIRIDVMDQWFSKDQGLPSWDNDEEADTSLATDKNIATLKFSANNIGIDGLNGFIRTSFSKKKEEYDDSSGSIGLGHQHSIYTTNRYSADVFIEWLTPVHSLSFTAGFNRDQYGVEDLLNLANPNDSARTSLSAGIQDGMAFFGGKLTITPGLRYTDIDDVLESAVSTSGAALEGLTQHSHYVSPQVSAMYRTTHWLMFKSNIARYFREPSFFELFGDRGFFLGNEDLKAEEGLNFDAGLQTDLTFSRFSLTRISITAAYFASDVDNRISRIYDARGVGKSMNISSSLVDGIETGITIDFLKYFRFSANATWQNSENRSSIRAYAGKQLPGIFGTSLLARLESNFYNFKVFFENVRDEGMYYDATNLIPAKDKVESNIGASWVYSHFQFDMEIKNVGDNLYEDFNGYPLPGRSWYLSVKYTV